MIIWSIIFISTEKTHSSVENYFLNPKHVSFPFSFKIVTKWTNIKKTQVRMMGFNYLGMNESVTLHLDPEKFLPKLSWMPMAGTETLLLNSLAPPAWLDMLNLLIFFFFPLKLKRQHLINTFCSGSYSLMKGSSSNSVAVARFSASATKHLRRKFLAISDISGGISGWTL